MREDGTIEADEESSDEELRRYDKKRKKKVSNEDWVSPRDADARITKLKDGRTHLAYKAEHVVDLQSEMVLAAEVYQADHADTETLVDCVMEAQVNLQAAGSEAEIQEVAADKGYHANATIELATDLNLRVYIPEPKLKHRRTWADKPESHRRAVVNNRQRMRRAKGRHSRCNEALPMCATRADRVDPGFARWWKSPNATASRPQRTTWRGSCGCSSGSASQGRSKLPPVLFALRSLS